MLFTGLWKNVAMDTEHNDDNIFDARGYRYNIGIIILNARGQAFWGKRRGQDAWQFPQGGLNAGESSEDAMLRELYEETGVHAEQVDILGVTSTWLCYRLPIRYRRGRQPGIVQCLGQKQKWFLLRLRDESSVAFDLQASGSPEFDDWCWIDYWLPANQVVYFKRKVYRQALKELANRFPIVPRSKPEKPPGDDGAKKTRQRHPPGAAVHTEAKRQEARPVKGMSGRL